MLNTPLNQYHQIVILTLIFMKLKVTLVLFMITIIIAGFSSTSRAQVVINEFSCSNLSQFIDNHSDYGDWIELYNTSASIVSLTGYYLSDDSINHTKWQFPAGITIAGNGFLRVWASSRNEVVGTTCHTNFSLKQTKNNNEWVVLCDPSGNFVDYKEMTQVTQLGHSYGRTQNGANNWSIFTTPTPNASNNTSVPYDDYADKPDFSIGAGFYSGTQTLAISTTETNSIIRYTLDGTLPTTSSAIYSAPISISATTVVKAITYSSSQYILPSFIRYETYFINVSHTLPVVSIAASYLTNLANGSGTILPIGSFEYFNTAQQRTAHTYGEFNRHGQDSWANSQRSLDFISRDEMGYNHSVEEVLFNTSARDNYQRVILRAAGDDNYPADHHPDNAGSAHLRDAYVHNLALLGGLDLDMRRGAKCIVYLNGQYWGVYDLRDNPDDHDNTEYYYGQDKYHLHFLERWGNRWAQYGGTAAENEWDTFYSYIMSHNMANAADYQYVTDRLDVKSLVDYVAVNMFTVCSDWLNWNTAWWRGTDSTGTHLKWGLMLWDNDATFGHYINYTGIPDITPAAQPCDPEGLDGQSDPDDFIGILLHLRQNPDFNQYYITRMVDLWNTTFSCDNMIPMLDSTAALIDPEMTAHAARWNGTYSEWLSNVQALRNFIIQRCTTLTTGFMGCYNLTGPYNLTLNTDPTGAGTIQLNSLSLSQFPWSGTYFGNINTDLKATANSGYNFVNWSSQNNQPFNPGASFATSSLALTTSDTVTAHFLTLSLPELVPPSKPGVHAYPTIFNQSTVIEYSVPSEMKVSLALFSVSGSKIADIVPENTTVQTGRYAVEIDFSKLQLPAGLYLLNFTAGNKYVNGVKLVYQSMK